jgi:hypothetical protein
MTSIKLHFWCQITLQAIKGLWFTCRAKFHQFTVFSAPGNKPCDSIHLYCINLTTNTYYPMQISYIGRFSCDFDTILETSCVWQWSKMHHAATYHWLNPMLKLLQALKLALTLTLTLACPPSTIQGQSQGHRVEAYINPIQRHNSNSPCNDPWQ